jgi:hypothetical protein
MSVESPEYDVLRQEGPFELRRYRGYLTASVRVTADGYGRATGDGFNPLADYIFGNNHASDRISMTAPVSAGRVCCQKIAMTAPVTSTHSDEDYVVSFTMPSSYSMEDLPVPNNPAVTLESVEPHMAAAVRFSGYLNEKDVSDAQAELDDWMAKQGLTPIGEPVAAQYDAPWKPWFARHNEILIPVEDAASDLH